MFFCDLGNKNADAEQFKGHPGRRKSSRRIDPGPPDSGARAHTHRHRSGRLSALRNADPAGSLLTAFMSIINRLGSRIEVKVRVRPAAVVAHEPRA